MGTFTQQITFIGPSGQEAETLEALVDTGSSFTTVAAPVLERLGVVPRRTVNLRLANGQVERRALGEVNVELDGMAGTIVCLFGDSEAPALIGAHTLQAFLLAVDPVQERLVPVEGYF